VFCKARNWMTLDYCIQSSTNKINVLNIQELNIPFQKLTWEHWCS
jgi:hypothetical protein